MADRAHQDSRMPGPDDAAGGSVPATVGGRAPHSLVRSCAWALAHALAIVLAFPPIGLWLLTLVAAAPLAWMALRARSTWRAVWVAFAAQYIAWLWLGRWLVDVTALGYPVYAANLAAYGALFVWMLRRAAIHPRFGRLPMTLLVPVLWVAMECIKGLVIWHGYPWFLAAHPLVEWPLLAQSADLLGAYFVSFLAVMCSGLLVDAARRRAGAMSTRAFAVSAVLAAALHLGNAGYGWWRLAQDEPLRDGPRILVIQTNLPQDNKIGWTREAQVRDFGGFIAQTRQAVAEAEADGPIDLVVWPETMLPGFGLEPATIETLVGGNYWPASLFSDAIARMREEIGTPMLVGSPVYLGLRVVDQRYAWDASYNSVYLIQGESPYQRYDKCVLTPFGETMPYISAWPWLEQRLLALGAAGMSFNLDAAAEPTRLDLRWRGGTTAIATPICFEDTVSGICRRMAWPDGARRIDLFINLSNDGWFGAYDGGRQQHAQSARYRCIENRVPMIRAANTGLSVLIDSTGKVTGRIGPGRYGQGRVAGHLDARPRLDSRATLYGRIGDAWAWLCLLVAAILVACSYIAVNRNNRTSTA